MTNLKKRAKLSKKEEVELCNLIIDVEKMLHDIILNAQHVKRVVDAIFEPICNN